MISPAELSQWRRLTLPVQFLVAGACVMIIAMFLVGNWVARRIEASVVQNSANSAALFMESMITPLSQELAQGETLSDDNKDALAEIFDGTALGERFISYKIWLKDGKIAHASDPNLWGKSFGLSDDLEIASSGMVASAFVDPHEHESAAEAALGIPLLEIYSPIRKTLTGEVIAVAEFYERAEGLIHDIQSARRTSWLVVSSAFLASGLLLFWIVQTGGRTILQQRSELEHQLHKTRLISGQNAVLRRRAISASSRSTAQTERTMRRIGFDLHDGPAQYLALAALRLDNAFEGRTDTNKDVDQVRFSLRQSLTELRLISRGLALPDLDRMDLIALVRRAVRDHEHRTDMAINLIVGELTDQPSDYAKKLCVFRFLQETLSNAARHSGVTTATVKVKQTGTVTRIHVADKGLGFDTAADRTTRSDGGLGLYGMTDRAESIGGSVHIHSRPGCGSVISLTLPQEERIS